MDPTIIGLLQVLARYERIVQALEEELTNLKTQDGDTTVRDA